MKIFKLLLILVMTNMYGQCWSEISAGDYFSVGIKNDNTLWWWGLTIGGTNLSAKIPTPTKIGTDNNWKKISAGNNFVLAIKSDGTLWGWGRNDIYQLGDNTNINKLTPVKIGNDNDWSEISAGDFGATALKTNGTIWAWGSFKDGTNNYYQTPTKIHNDVGWLKISQNRNVRLAIKSDGTLWGKLDTHNSQFQKINSSINNWSEVSRGFDINQTYGIRADKTLWKIYITSTGANYENLVATNTQIGTDNDWSSLNAGKEYHMILMKADKSIWGFGRNTFGELGIGNYIDQNNLPVRIGNANNWKKYSVGRFHTFFLNDNNQLYATGNNNYGNLGDGTFTSTNTPKLIDCSNMGTVENNLEKISIYPNPSAETIYVKKMDNSSIKKLEIIDASGKTISIPASEKINIKYLPKGNYILKLHLPNEVITKKFIKI